MSLVLGLVLALLAILARAGLRPGRPPIELLPAAEATPPPPSAEEPPLVTIDPGHGGADPGGKHYDGQGIVDLTEASVNLQIALLLRDKLEASGCRVYLR